MNALSAPRIQPPDARPGLPARGHEMPGPEKGLPCQRHWQFIEKGRQAAFSNGYDGACLASPEKGMRGLRDALRGHFHLFEEPETQPGELTGCNARLLRRAGGRA